MGIFDADWYRVSLRSDGIDPFYKATADERSWLARHVTERLDVE